MSRYIDADALLKKLPNDLQYKASVKRVLIQAPTADVVEVVRCGECIHRNSLRPSCTVRRKDFFCAYGERRTTDE
jgi:hypothetical protein